MTGGINSTAATLLLISLHFIYCSGLCSINHLLASNLNLMQVFLRSFSVLFHLCTIRSISVFLPYTHRVHCSPSLSFHFTFSASAAPCLPHIQYKCLSGQIVFSLCQSGSLSIFVSCTSLLHHSLILCGSNVLTFGSGTTLLLSLCFICFP